MHGVSYHENKFLTFVVRWAADMSSHIQKIICKILCLSGSCQHSHSSICLSWEEIILCSVITVTCAGNSKIYPSRISSILCFCQSSRLTWMWSQFRQYMKNLNSAVVQTFFEHRKLWKRLLLWQLAGCVCGAPVSSQLKSQNHKGVVQ